MRSRISNTSSTNGCSRCISFGGRSGGGTAISSQDRPGRRREHVDAIAEIHGLLDRVRHEEHRRLRLAPQLDQQLLHVQPRRRIERAERLVHQDDARRQDQRAGDGHALPHAARQLAAGTCARRASRRGRPWRSTRAPARAARAPARRGTRGRTRRCPRPCGCRTTCSPGRPCRGPAPGPPTGLPLHQHRAGGGGMLRRAGRRSAAARSTCRSRTARESRRTRPCPGRSGDREGHVADDA